MGSSTMTKEMASKMRLDKRNSSSTSTRGKSAESDRIPVGDWRVKQLSDLYIHGTQGSLAFQGHITQDAIRNLSRQVGNHAVQCEVLQRQKEDEGWFNKIINEGGELLSNPLAYPGKKAKSAKNWMKAKAKEKYKGAKKWLKDLF